MPTIEFVDVTEEVCIGDLFAAVGFSHDVAPSDSEGDSFIENTWGIEALSLDAFYPIEGFRWTKLERQVTLSHRGTDGSISSLQCSPEHLVLRQGKSSDWVNVGDLRKGDVVVGRHGLRTVTEIVKVNGEERLCDLQVAIAHSYFANDVLSHNSHFLTFLGAAAIRNGVDVVHYTFELSEAAVGRRYDSNLCDINSNDVIDSKESILDQYSKKKFGHLTIKEFPTNTASIYTLRSHLERLDLKGIRPGLIIIDYADIMRSSRAYDSLRHELKLIYEELRAMASERKVPIWTASQSNKEGSNAEIIDLSNMSEAYGKAMVADVVLGLSRRSYEKYEGSGRLYVSKNRAGKDGIVFPVKIDTGKSTFEITGGSTTPEDVTKDNEQGFKRALQQKWKEVQESGLLGTKDSAQGRPESIDS